MLCRHSSGAPSTSPSKTTPTSAARASVRSPIAGWWSVPASPRAPDLVAGRAAGERIRKAIALVNEVADGAGDEEITPTEIAEAIRDCLELTEIEQGSNVRKYLGEALDATSDGMPADFVAMTLYAALGALGESRSGS